MLTRKNIIYNPNRFIFIDDKLINVQAAQSVGMHAIHFKNARQLRKELHTLKTYVKTNEKNIINVTFKKSFLSHYSA